MTIKSSIENSLKWFKKKIENSFNVKLWNKNKNKKEWIYNHVTKQLRTEFKDTFESVEYHPMPVIGSMYMYIYDPKWKNVLPYYDTFPLIFPLSYYDNGFLGINFHYLDPMTREKFLDALVKAGKRAKNEEEYIQATYGFMKGLTEFDIFKHTIKRYLFDHVRTPFARIHSNEWYNAIYMPTESFQKEGRRTVWKKSMGTI